MSLRELYDRAKAAGIPLGEWAVVSLPGGQGHAFTRCHAVRTEQEAADALDRMCREVMKTMLPGCWLQYVPGGGSQAWAVMPDIAALVVGPSQSAVIITAIEARREETPCP